MIPSDRNLIVQECGSIYVCDWRESYEKLIFNREFSTIYCELLAAYVEGNWSTRE